MVFVCEFPETFEPLNLQDYIVPLGTILQPICFNELSKNFRLGVDQIKNFFVAVLEHLKNKFLLLVLPLRIFQFLYLWIATQLVEHHLKVIFTGARRLVGVIIAVLVEVAHLEEHNRTAGS